jgi:hypothetical protein
MAKSSGGRLESLGIFKDLWAFMRVRKKWWLGPDPGHDAAALAADRDDPGLRGGAVHLRAVLAERPRR